MNKVTLGISITALTLAGPAYASHHQGHGADADHNRTITRAEAQTHAGEMFAKMDANTDGKLDAADRAAHETTMRAEHFAKLDTNKDGSISRQEFDVAHSGGADRGHGMGGDHGVKRGMMGHGGGHGGMGGAMMMMQMADTNKDQAVSRDEFEAAHLQHFTMADTNKDGSVTREERQAAKAKMRAHMQGMGNKMSGHDMAPPPPAN